MSNKYLITAVQMESPRGDSGLTIRAGITESSDLNTAQAIAAFDHDYAGLGFMPVAVFSVEISLEALEHAVAVLRGDKPVETATPKQEPLSRDEAAELDRYLTKQGAWSRPATAEPPPAPGPLNFKDAPE